VVQKVVPIDVAASAAERAREWIARIDSGALDPDERARLKAWLAEDSSHAKLLDTHALLWSAAARAKFPPAATAANDVYRPRTAFRGGWQLPAVAAGFASLAVAVVLVLVVPRFGAVQQSMAFSTEVGQHRPVELQDGSSVHLNTGSSVRVNYAKERRGVLLERGEGYFSVAKDASRPFEVTAGSTVVRAVGTRFTVRRFENGDTEVVVFEGVVEVRRTAEGSTGSQSTAVGGGPQPVRLGVGQVASEFKDSVVLKSLNDTELHRELAWQQDRIVFDNTPLSDAVAEVNRYTKTPLLIDDAALGSIPVSGAFSTHDVPVFLRSLEHGFGLKVEQRSGTYQISSAAKS